MMTSAECLAKAHEALSVGATALTPDVTRAWEAVAAQWTALAAQAEAHESLRRIFLDGSASLSALCPEGRVGSISALALWPEWVETRRWRTADQRTFGAAISDISENSSLEPDLRTEVR